MFYDLALPALGVDSNAAASASSAVAAASINDAAARSLDRLLTAVSLGFSVVAIEREAYGRLNAAEEAGPPPGSLVSRSALAAAAAGAVASASVGRIPRRPALRISSAEPHGGGGRGGGGGSLLAPARRSHASPQTITQLTRLTLTTGDPGEAAAVLGNRIGKAGGGGAGAVVAANRGNNGSTAAADAADAADAPSTSAPQNPSSIPFSARRSYDILAIRPLNSRVLAQAATSLDVDVIVLDFTGSGGGSSSSGGGSASKRPPPQAQPQSSFSLARMPKPAALRPALARGISLEIRYSPALSSEQERRALLAGLSSLATTLRGKGGGGGSGNTRNPNAECLVPFVLSSGAVDANSLRAPLDAAALAQVAGLSGSAALAAVTRVPAQVAARARKRRAASRGECGFLWGQEGMREVAAMELDRERKKRKKAGSGGGMQYNQQARRPQQVGGGGGGGGKKGKKKR